MSCYLSTRIRWKALLAGAVLLGMLSSPLWAATTGKIAGRVVDQASGEPIPGAAVRIEALRLGSTTDLDGRYFIIGVPPGRHDVAASLVGYAPVTVMDVLVNIDRTTPLDIELSESAVEVAGVTVVAEREVIQLDVAGSRSTLTSEDVLELPSITTLSGAIGREPGVGGTTIRGGLPEETQLMINGHYMTDVRRNTFSAASIPLTSVQEVQILTSGFNAEYGNARSGIINVVLRDEPRRYWSTVQFVLNPAQKRHNGDAPVYGENAPEWKAFGSEESLTTTLSIPNVYTEHPTDSTMVFRSWMGLTGRQDSYEDSLTKAKRLREFWRIRHRFTEDDYAGEDGYTLDLSVGGPVPLVPGVSFIYSHRNTRGLRTI